MTIDVGEQSVGVAVNTLGEDHPVFISKLQANGAFAAAGLVSEGQEIVSINGDACESLETVDVIAFAQDVSTKGESTRVTKPCRAPRRIATAASQLSEWRRGRT